MQKALRAPPRSRKLIALWQRIGTQYANRDKHPDERHTYPSTYGRWIASDTLSISRRLADAMNAWSEFTENEYAAIWDRFYSDFDFKPDYHERNKPAISEPQPFITFDLSAKLNDGTNSEIDELLHEAFRLITPDGQLIYWLDWHHTCYVYNPLRADGNGPVSWYPDGDYYIFLAHDFSWGTFGHPWQQSLCVFGASLLNLVDQPLRDRLTVLRESPPNETVG